MRRGICASACHALGLTPCTQTLHVTTATLLGNKSYSERCVTAWQPLLGVSFNNSAAATLTGREREGADSAAAHLQVSVSWCGLMLALRSLRTGPGSMVGRPVAEVVVVHVEEILRSRPGCRLRLRRCRCRTGHTITTPSYASIYLLFLF